MYNTLSIFEERKRELELYYSIMLDIDNDSPKIQTIDNSAFFKILKSNFILMLYNLIEACIVSGILEIYEELKQDGCSYYDVIEEIRKLWRNRQVSNVYAPTSKRQTYEKKVNDIIKTITDKVPITLNREELKSVGGNLDDKAIMSICDKHRIRYVVDDSSEKLRTVRIRRNSLSHGNMSFSDCGRDFTLGDLREIQDSVIKFMQSILDGMKAYYESHGFKVQIS